LPGTVAELASKTGLPRPRVSTHANYWRRAGFYTKDANGRFHRVR
jgi:hypothetical protein